MRIIKNILLVPVVWGFMILAAVFAPVLFLLGFEVKVTANKVRQ